MTQHFLLPKKVRTLSIVKIAMMPDEEIHNIFKQIRWSANAGEPICPHCGTTSYSNKKSVSIFENRYATDLKAMDFNRDGYEDMVFIVNSLDGLSFEFAIVYGSANGLVPSSLEYKKTTYNISATGRTLNVGDINGDGRDELIVDNVVFVINKDSLELYIQGADGAHVEAVVEDINQDNKDDIIMLYENSVGVIVGISTFSY